MRRRWTITLMASVPVSTAARLICTACWGVIVPSALRHRPGPSWVPFDTVIAIDRLLTDLGLRRSACARWRLLANEGPCPRLLCARNSTSITLADKEAGWGYP